MRMLMCAIAIGYMLFGMYQFALGDYQAFAVFVWASVVIGSLSKLGAKPEVRPEVDE